MSFSLSQSLEKEHFLDNGVSVSTSNVEDHKDYFTLQNPFGSSLNFKFNNSETPSFIKLYDSAGKNVVTVHDNSHLETHHLRAGVYFYVLEVDGHTFSGRVVKN